MSRVVVLAGGSPHAHDFDSIGCALAELVAALGHEVQVVHDPDEAAACVGAAAPGGAVDALVVAGLWWRMEGPAYESWRDRFAYSPPTQTRDGLLRFVAGGGGLLAVHTAVICFDDWPGWGEVVGGSWRWGSSSHPPHGPVEARIVADHPAVAGLPPTIVLHDEVYGDLAVGDDVEVLAVARRQPDDADQPVVWAHRFGAGRVVFDGFGHDAASVRHPHNARLLGQALAWVTGRS